MNQEDKDWLMKNGFSPSENIDHALFYQRWFKEGHFTVTPTADLTYIDFYPTDSHLRVFSVSGGKPVHILFSHLIEEINTVMYSLRNTKMQICEFC